MYLKCAIRVLADKFPQLVQFENGKIKYYVNFLKRTGSIIDTLGIAKGTSGQQHLISSYEAIIKKLKHKPMQSPVIILCDNDEGITKICSTIKKTFKGSLVVSFETSEQFYHITKNLYLVKIPCEPQKLAIENLFKPDLLNKKLGGKSFDLIIKEENKSKNVDNKRESSYSKQVFAEKIVKAQQKKIDFSGFEPLLDRIKACVSHYDNSDY